MSFTKAYSHLRNQHGRTEVVFSGSVEGELQTWRFVRAFAASPRHSKPPTRCCKYKSCVKTMPRTSASSCELADACAGNAR